MSKRYDCRDPQERLAGIEAAVTAARQASWWSCPTDTVYGIGADAFILGGRRRPCWRPRAGAGTCPPPVLVGTARARCAALVDGPRRVRARTSIDEFWPGALTLVFRAPARRCSGTWATPRARSRMRMPLHSVALDVLKQTGPLAVSSANRHGHPSAINADEAEQQLGEAVSIYLDGGPSTDNVPSTILDLTGTIPKVLRSGAISVDRPGGVFGHRGERALRGGTGRRQAGRASARNRSGRPRHR